MFEVIQGSQNYHAIISNVVCGHFLGLTSVDDRSENNGWSRVPEDDCRNGRELTKIVEDFDRAVNVEAPSQ